MAANSAKNLVPGYADWTLAFQIVQAPVEFCTLGSGERNRLGRSCKAVPQLLEQVEPLLRTQRCDVKATLAHARSITSRAVRPQYGERWRLHCCVGLRLERLNLSGYSIQSPQLLRPRSGVRRAPKTLRPATCLSAACPVRTRGEAPSV